MITRSDLNEEAFDQLIRLELIDQLAGIEMDGLEESFVRAKLIEAFNIVIAYNSIPGTYKNGEFDC